MITPSLPYNSLLVLGSKAFLSIQLLRDQPCIRYFSLLFFFLSQTLELNHQRSMLNPTNSFYSSKASIFWILTCIWFNHHLFEDWIWVKCIYDFLLILAFWFVIGLGGWLVCVIWMDPMIQRFWVWVEEEREWVERRKKNISEIFLIIDFKYFDIYRHK